MLTGTSVSITIVGSSFTAFSSLSTNPCFSIPMVSNSYNRGFLKIQHIINVMVYIPFSSWKQCMTNCSSHVLQTFHCIPVNKMTNLNFTVCEYYLQGILGLLAIPWHSRSFFCAQHSQLHTSLQ